MSSIKEIQAEFKKAIFREGGNKLIPFCGLGSVEAVKVRVTYIAHVLICSEGGQNQDRFQIEHTPNNKDKTWVVIHSASGTQHQGLTLIDAVNAFLASELN